MAVTGTALVASPASADKIPDGTTDFFIMGGRFAFGTSPTGAIDLPLGHPDRPPECADGVDNESGESHNGWDGSAFRPFVTAEDTLVDYPADSSCINAADDSELIDRPNKVPDPTPLCGSEGTTNNNIPCSTAGSFKDAVQIPSGVSSGWNGNTNRDRASIVFGDGNATTGQASVRNRATGGTVSGTNITVPSGNVVFGSGYQMIASCQRANAIITTFTICLDLYIQFRVIPAGNVTGTTNTDGSGTLNAPINLEIWIAATNGSTQVDVFGTKSPVSAKCRTSSPVVVSGTTGTSGSLTGIGYDANRKNFKVVDSAVNFPTFTRLAQGGTLNSTNLCDEVGNTIGLPDAAGEVELVVSTEQNTVTSGTSQTGTGMASFPGLQPPVSKVQTGVNGGALGSASSGDVVINVNEGDVVEIDNGASYDPALRDVLNPTEWTQGVSRSGGTGPVPAAINNQGTSHRFVAPDAPLAGNTQVFTSSVDAWLGPIAVGSAGEQHQTDTNTVTVNVANVAPTADAGPDQLVDGGTNVVLTGSSSDLGDPENQRTYCWTQTAGTSVGLPACSPGNGKVQNFVPANADETLTFQLVVSDDDGGTSSPSIVNVQTRAVTSQTISGYVTDSSSGAPLTFAANTAKVDLFNGSAYVGTTFVQAGGYYEFTGVPAGSSYTVRGRASGYEGVYNGGRAVQKFAPLLSNSTATADLALMPSSGISNVVGTIVDDAASPVGSAQVVLFGSDGGSVYKTGSVGDGSFGMPEIQPGDGYTLRYYAPGHFPRYFDNKAKANQADVFSVLSGADKDLGTMTLPSTSLTGSITGNVSSGGSPLVGFEVRAYDATTMSYVRLALTDGSGNYTLDVPPGDYKLWFTDKGNPGTYSIWWDGLPGEPGDGTHLIADVVSVTSGGTTANIDADIP